MTEEAEKPDGIYNTYFILPTMPGQRANWSVGGLSACPPASSSSLLNSWNRQRRFQLQREEKAGGPSFWEPEGGGEIQGGV